MRSQLLIVLLVLILAAVLLAAQGTPQQRIGIVDLNQVFEGYSQKDQLEAELATVKKKMEEQFDKIDNELKQLRGELELTEKGTTRYGEIEDRAAALIQKRKRLNRESSQEFQERKLAFHDQLLTHIDQTIQAFAIEQGYTTILQREFTLSTQSLSWKSVLFAAPETDVTAHILARLNKTRQ
ncbi:MAG: OmpH family outer membrane protein [Planctomycetota bacterium]